MSGSRSQVLYDSIVRTRSSTDELNTLADEARERVADNGLRQIAAQALQGAGDQVVNAKTVLPWLLSTLGAPSMLLALLVPVRESGSMLPQAAMTPYLRRMRHRKRAWLVGAAGQAVAAVAMAFFAAATRGWVAGLGLLGSLALFALARALCSLASKDVLGRTIPPGQRGQINGSVTVASGVVALTLGLALRWWGDELDETTVAVLLAASALAWFLAIAVYAGIAEPAETSAPGDPGGRTPGWVAASWSLISSDRTFRRFVTVRSLLLVSALSPPFVIALGVAEGSAGVSGLGLFVLAQGIASLVGGQFFGRMADRSSRLLMVWCALGSSVVIGVFLLLLGLDDVRRSAWLYPATYLLLALVHLGTRVARKTYVVDIAEGDRRTEYVAVSNTVMGVLLLVVGAVTGILSQWGPDLALILLAGLGLAGAALGRLLPEPDHR